MYQLEQYKVFLILLMHGANMKIVKSSGHNLEDIAVKTAHCLGQHTAARVWLRTEQIQFSTDRPKRSTKYHFSFLNLNIKTTFDLLFPFLVVPAS